MTRKLIDLYGVNIVSFYGGKDRGKCIQITIDDKWIQLTTEQFIHLVSVMIQLSPTLLDSGGTSLEV